MQEASKVWDQTGLYIKCQASLRYRAKGHIALLSESLETTKGNIIEVPGQQVKERRMLEELQERIPNGTQHSSQNLPGRMKRIKPKSQGPEAHTSCASNSSGMAARLEHTCRRQIRNDKTEVSEQANSRQRLLLSTNRTPKPELPGQVHQKPDPDPPPSARWNGNRQKNKN